MLHGFVALHVEAIEPNTHADIPTSSKSFLAIAVWLLNSWRYIYIYI